MLNVTKVKKRLKIVLIGLSIISSSAMEDEIKKNSNDILNESFSNSDINSEYSDIVDQILAKIEKLDKIFDFNEIYETTYNEELKNIVKTLINLRYSHKHKINTEEGVEELKNIYFVLCENMVKFSIYLFYNDEKGNILIKKDILENVLKPLIKIEKDIAKNNYFETDFVYENYLCQYIQLKVTNLLYDFYRDINKAYHKYFKVTDLLFDFLREDVKDIEKKRMNEIISRVKYLNKFNFEIQAPDYLSDGAWFTKYICDECDNDIFKKEATIIGRLHQSLLKGDYIYKIHDANNYVFKDQIKNLHYNETLYKGIIACIVSSSHEYIHNIIRKSKILNKIVNKDYYNSDFLKMHGNLINNLENLSDNNKLELNKNVENIVNFNDYKESLEKISKLFSEYENQTKDEKQSENIKQYEKEISEFYNSHMNDRPYGEEFFTSNTDLFILGNHIFNFYSFIILNNEICKIYDKHEKYSILLNKQTSVHDNIKNNNIKKCNIINENENYVICNNKNTKIFLFNDKNIFETNFVNELKNDKILDEKYNLKELNIENLKDFVNIEFLEKIIHSEKPFRLFISLRFDAFDYLKNIMEYGYKINSCYNSDCFTIITNEVNLIETIDNTNFYKDYNQKDYCKSKNKYTSIFNKHSIEELKLKTFGNFENSSKIDFSYLFEDCAFSLIDLSNCKFNECELEGLFSNCRDVEEIILPEVCFSCKNISNMFENCILLEVINNEKNFFIKNIEKMDNLFYNCENLTEIDFMSKMDISKVKNLNHLFYNCKKLKKINNFSNLKFTNINDLSYLFANCKNLESIKLPTLSQENYINCEAVFKNCEKLKNIYFVSNNIIKVKNMKYAFCGCKHLESCDFINNFNTNELENIDYMFCNMFSLKSISFQTSFNTKNIVNMEGIFANCNNLERIDLQKFNTSYVINMKNMFYNCRSLKNIDLSNFQLKNVRNMSYMFYNCNNIENISMPSKYETSNLENTQNMFYNCWKLKNIDLSIFIFSKVKYMSKMFFNCYDLKSINCNIISNIESTKDKVGIFLNCKNLDIKSIKSINDKFIKKQILDLQLLYSENNKIEKNK